MIKETEAWAIVDKDGKQIDTSWIKPETIEQLKLAGFTIEPLKIVNKDAVVIDREVYDKVQNWAMLTTIDNDEVPEWLKQFLSAGGKDTGALPSATPNASNTAGDPNDN